MTFARFFTIAASCSLPLLLLLQPNFIHVMLKSWSQKFWKVIVRKLWKLRVRVGHFRVLPTL